MTKLQNWNKWTDLNYWIKYWTAEFDGLLLKNYLISLVLRN